MDELNNPTTLSIDDLSAPLGKPSGWETGTGPVEREGIDAFSVPDEPTLSEKAREIMYGTEIGAIQGGGTFGTALAGARVGAAATPPVLPIVGPFAKPIGALVGFGTGLTAGYLATSNVDQLFPEVSREDLIPYREGGKTFGESIGVAPIAFGIPAMQANRISRFVSGIGEGARKYPKSFIASEIMGGAGAGIAGGISESYYPGEAGPRFGAEVAGGFFSPGRFLVSTAGAVADFTKGLLSSMSPSAREGRAANALYNALNEAGSDVPKIIKALETKVPAGVTPTAAQKTGDEGLTMLETTLARGNSKYGAEIMKQGQDSIKAYEKIIEKLRDIGTPEALTKAAELRAAKTEALLEGRLALADADASTKIAKITKDTPQARYDIGQIVRSETERALADARAHEKELWNRAYKGSLRTKTVKGEKVLALKQVSPANTAESFLEIASSMTPERFDLRMPTEVKRIMARLGIDKEAINKYSAGKLTPEYLETGKVPSQYLTKTEGKKVVPLFKETDVQDLINVRSDLLAFAREAAAKGETANAGFYGRMAESALDDLASSKNPAYDEARQFSRQLNDFFTRTYAGEVSAVTKKGADKLPAEILVSRAFGSGADTTSLRMADIEDAVGMMGSQYDAAVAKFGSRSAQAQALKPFADASKQSVVSIRDAQSRAMRLAAAKTIDPITGRVNPTSLQRFVNENQAVLDRLNITADLTDAVKAENAFRAIQTDTSRVNKALNNQAAFAQVLKFENPTSAITDALNSRYPVKNFNGIVRLAKSGGPEAVDGLKASLYDYAFTKAGGENRFSPAAFDKALFQPIAPGQPSIYNILRSQNAMTITEAKNLRNLIKPMERIETAIKNNQLTDEVIQGADAVTELALRAAGAKLGASLTPGSAGSLVAASAGSKFMRKQFDKMPTFMVRGIIEQATQDPQLMALLLKRGVTQREKFQISRQLHSYLGAAGLNYAELDNEPMPAEEAPVEPTRRARKLMQDLPSAPTRGSITPSRPAAPNVGAPTQGGTGLPPLPASPAGPSNSRKMLQSLFPMDTISGMGAEQNFSTRFIHSSLYRTNSWPAVEYSIVEPSCTAINTTPYSILVP